MNPNDFKRDIVSRHIRDVGDAPGIGRIGRMHESAASATGGGRGRRRSRSRGGRTVNHAWVSLGLGVVALMVLLGAVVLWLVPMVQRGRSVSGTLENGRAGEEAGVRVASRFGSPSKDEAVMLVESALANRDPDQVEKLFRMGGASISQVISFCAGLEESDGKFTGCQWLSSIDSPQALLEGVVVSFQAVDFSSHQRLALLTPDANGCWQVDFEALARAVSPSWQEILKPDSGLALVRVTLAPDFYYNGPFQDESKWASYGMSSPDLDFLIRGYCRRDTPEAQTVARMFTDGSKAARATLEIRHVVGGSKKQFEITRVVAQDWVVPTTAPPMKRLKSGL